MKDKLSYYRSLSFEELIALPMEQYHEYLALLLEESNRNFHACLASMENEEGFVDVRGKNCNIVIDTMDSEHIYSCMHKAEFRVLIEEYAILDSIRHYLLSNSEVHANACITPYVCSFCDILERVICERVVHSQSVTVSCDW